MKSTGLRCENCGPFKPGVKVMGHEIREGDHCYYCNAILKSDTK